MQNFAKFGPKSHIFLQTSQKIAKIRYRRILRRGVLVAIRLCENTGSKHEAGCQNRQNAIRRPCGLRAANVQARRFQAILCRVSGFLWTYRSPCYDYFGSATSGEENVEFNGNVIVIQFLDFNHTDANASINVSKFSPRWNLRQIHCWAV